MTLAINDIYHTNLIKPRLLKNDSHGYTQPLHKFPYIKLEYKLSIMYT